MSGYALDPGELSSASGTLRDLGASTKQHSRTVTVTPDAGSSSREVASAFARFADELTAAGDLLASAAHTVEASLREYQTTDRTAASTYRGIVR